MQYNTFIIYGVYCTGYRVTRIGSYRSQPTGIILGCGIFLQPFLSVYNQQLRNTIVVEEHKTKTVVTIKMGKHISVTTLRN